MSTRAGSLLRSVRVRLTLAATLVTAVAVLLAGLWLVRSVEGSIEARIRDEEAARLAQARQALQAGAAPEEVLVLSAAHGDGYLQIVADGRVLAASPGVADLPPLYTLTPEGDVIRIERRRMVLSQAVVDSPSGPMQVLAASPLDAVRRGVDAVQEGLVIAFPLLVGAVAALAWVLAGRALNPVESIRTEVEAISASTLDRRVPVPASDDEVARLARTMNAMLDRLQTASARQQRFVADASHELRSPVATIRTELEVALRTATPDEWPAVAERLLGEEARLEAVIADLLLLARLDEEAPDPDAVPVDLASEAREAVARRRLRSGPVTVEVKAPTPVVVQGAAVQLRRVLGNLLDNAARHAEGRVLVTVEAVEGRARLLVDDDGPGIAPEDRERAFERFTRLEDHRGRGDGGGAGLGLSLVRRIAERHGGTAAAGEAPLGGARLTVDLPLG